MVVNFCAAMFTVMLLLLGLFYALKKLGETLKKNSALDETL